MFAVSGCTANEAFFFDLPEPKSDTGEIVANLWQGSWIAAWGVGIFTWGLMLVAAVMFYRRKKNADQIPAQMRYNIPIEMLYTIVPLVMILGLFFFTARDQTEILTVKNDQAQTINVVGWRWSWGFNYLDKDVYSVGTPEDIPVLEVPVGQKIRFELTSPDVIHSFWVPDWLFKMDVVPGRENVFEITPTVEGTFAGRCAELCGTEHSGMLFTVKVVSVDEYNAWIQGLKDKGQTGKLSSGNVVTSGKNDSERNL